MKNEFHYNRGVYKQLMQKRIHKILLVCSSYDAFILEEDGRIDEQIFNEYVSLNLRYPPFFIRVPSEKKAIEEINKGDIDLVIAMPSVRDVDLFDFVKRIKKKYIWIPVVILTPFSRDISLRMKTENLETIDYIFSWLGNTDIMLAIIKLVEDKLNAENDINRGVQTILLVEDSVRYYSSFLSIMYKMIFEETTNLEIDTLNEHQRMLRKRGRPKVLLANTYEDALLLFEKYKKNILGIISDVGYPINGERDKHAGIKLCKYIQKNNPHIPLLLQSSNIENRKWSNELSIGFLYKNSPNLLHKLSSFMKRYFAFGNFVFINPKTKTELMKAKDLKSLQKLIYKVPAYSLIYHLERNHLSRWLKTRALFSLGEYLREFSIQQFANLDEMRAFIANSIRVFRKEESSGIIAQFDIKKYDEYVGFARVGDGMLGGKARGLAFLNLIISKHTIFKTFKNVSIQIPKTIVLATTVFDEFMEKNDLFEFALSDIPDKDILNKFITAVFPSKYIPQLLKFLEVINKPIAARSSSLLEDSHYQPFAGVYSTYMIPYSDSIQITLKNLLIAIKSVYASVYYKESKMYMKATQNVIDEEKMAVVLQEICGEPHGEKFYPVISGVGRSINFYPIGLEKTEDGIINLAFGLGKQIVEGKTTLRFSPGAPDKILQLHDPKTALQQTQKHFYALDTSNNALEPSTDDSVTLKKYRINNAENDKTLDFIASSYDFTTDTLNDGTHYEGKKVITFNNILKYNRFPLNDILKTILRIGSKEMGNPVEIEFALNFDFKNSKIIDFKLLQIRPIVDNEETVNINIEKIDKDETILISNSALGNGIINNVYDLIYVKPETFDSKYNIEIAEIIGKLNENFVNEKRNYYLVGPGRWGSRDRWLGIPVTWPQISAARIIVESGLNNYRIEPSQGTHFFQNLTSFRIGYFTINPFSNDGFFDTDFLKDIPTVYEDDFVRHIKFEKPLVSVIDGKKQIGIIYKPGYSEEREIDIVH